MLFTAFMFNGLFLGVVAILALIGVIIMIVTMCFKDPGNIPQVLRQILSARWILAVMAGVSFVAFCAAVAIAMIAQRMDFKPEVIVSVLGMLLLVIQGVYKDYFHRSRENDNGGDSTIQSNVSSTTATTTVPIVHPVDPVDPEVKPEVK